MIKRAITDQVKKALRNSPVVGLVGPRQVGKTTVAKMLMIDRGLKVHYLDLERPSDLRKLEDPELYLQAFSDELVIIDEAQRKPDLFPLIRSLVDEQPAKKGRFLILGSASPALRRQAAESLAGRIGYYELTGFMLSEVATHTDSNTNLWLRGGLPPSYLARSKDLSFHWREDFIRTYLERDIPSLGLQAPASMLMRFWQMVAHCHGQVWNASHIAASMGISPPTARRYLDILQDTYMIRQLQPFYSNIKKRLVKSPKIYLRDSGLLHTLLGISDHPTLISHPAVGSSWEGWVLEQIAAILPGGPTLTFYRTGAGAEIDLVIQRTLSQQAIAVEIKYSLSPKLPKGFWNALDDLKPKIAYVVYPGKEYYPIAEKVYALPVSELHRIAES